MGQEKEGEYSVSDGRVFGYTNKIIAGKLVRTYCEISRDKDQYEAHKQKEKEAAAKIKEAASKKTKNKK